MNTKHLEIFKKRIIDNEERIKNRTEIIKNLNETLLLLNNFKDQNPIQAEKLNTLSHINFIYRNIKNDSDDLAKLIVRNQTYKEIVTTYEKI